MQYALRAHHEVARRRAPHGRRALRGNKSPTNRSTGDSRGCAQCAWHSERVNRNIADIPLRAHNEKECNGRQSTDAASSRTNHRQHAKQLLQEADSLAGAAAAGSESDGAADGS